MKKVLIDTDVILDFFFDRKPFSEEAAKVLSLCESNEIQGFITPVILSNCYCLLKQTAKHEKVIEKLKLLLSFIDILIIDKEIILQAMNSNFIDLEDALQNYAAENFTEISLILTRNCKDFKHSRISILSPQNYIDSRIGLG